MQGDERLLVKHLEYPGFYRVVAWYGYVNQVDQGPAFVKALLQQLELEQRIIIASKTKVLKLQACLSCSFTDSSCQSLAPRLRTGCWLE